MSMSRKHFEALAAALEDVYIESRSMGTPEDVATLAAYKVANVCARFNPNFDRARFLKACGVEEHEHKWEQMNDFRPFCSCGAVKEAK